MANERTAFSQARVASASGAVVAAELIPAPSSAQKIVIHQLFFSADFSIEITLDDTTAGEIWSQFVGTNGGSVVPATGSPWCEATAGEAVTYSHGAGGASAVVAVYEIVNV